MGTYLPHPGFFSEQSHFSTDLEATTAPYLNVATDEKAIDKPRSEGNRCTCICNVWDSVCGVLFIVTLIVAIAFSGFVFQATYQYVFRLYLEFLSPSYLFMFWDNNLGLVITVCSVALALPSICTITICCSRSWQGSADKIWCSAPFAWLAFGSAFSIILLVRKNYWYAVLFAAPTALVTVLCFVAYGCNDGRRRIRQSAGILNISLMVNHNETSWPLRYYFRAATGILVAVVVHFLLFWLNVAILSDLTVDNNGRTKSHARTSHNATKKVSKASKLSKALKSYSAEDFWVYVKQRNHALGLSVACLIFSLIILGPMVQGLVYHRISRRYARYLRPQIPRKRCWDGCCTRGQSWTYYCIIAVGTFLLTIFHIWLRFPRQLLNKWEWGSNYGENINRYAFCYIAMYGDGSSNTEDPSKVINKGYRGLSKAVFQRMEKKITQQIVDSIIIEPLFDILASLNGAICAFPTYLVLKIHKPQYLLHGSWVTALMVIGAYVVGYMVFHAFTVSIQAGIDTIITQLACEESRLDGLSMQHRRILLDDVDSLLVTWWDELRLTSGLKERPYLIDEGWNLPPPTKKAANEKVGIPLETQVYGDPSWPSSVETLVNSHDYIPPNVVPAQGSKPPSDGRTDGYDPQNVF